MNIDATSVLTFQATLLSHERLDEAATALATELALKLGFDRVAIGMLEGGHAVVKAVSHSADVRPKYEAHHAIAKAMDEAMEQAAVIASVEMPGSPPRVMLAQRALARASGSQVFTVPLANNQRIYGALTFERAANEPLPGDLIDYCENLANLLGPLLLLKWQEAHPWYWRLGAAIKRRLLRLGFWFRLFAYGTFVAILVLLFLPAQFDISAPARLEGSIQRTLVAPDNGFLEQSHVRPGDRVKQGQVLAEMSDQDYQLEKRKLESELAQHENAYGAALAKADLVQLVVNQAKAAEVSAQLDLVEQKLQRAKLTAPFDGVIIKGDLRQSLGAPVQRGDVLITLAPVDDYRLMIEVDERDIAFVQGGLQGRVALVSLPGKTFGFRIERITPVAATREGRNFFEAEAKLVDGGRQSLRPGLEGVARIDAGSQPFIWIWTRRVLDAARIAVWSWGL